MATLNFTKHGQWYISDAITPTDEESVIVNIQSSDDKTHRLVVEHSINQKFWMVCGSTTYIDGIEMAVEGIRAGEQSVRFKTDALPKNAEWI